MFGLGGKEKCSVGEAILDKLNQGPPEQDPIYAGGSPTENAKNIIGSIRHQGCHRWLYNNSGFTWKLIAPQNDNGFMCDGAAECLAPPFAGVSIHWRSYGDQKQLFRLMAFVASDADVSKPKDGGIVFDQVLKVTDETDFRTTCADIVDYNGDDLVVNSPSDADISTCGTSYDHAATWTHDVRGAHVCKFKIPEPTPEEISMQYYRQTPKWCQDRTWEDGIIFEFDHCAKHGGVCRTGCDSLPAKPYSEIYNKQPPATKQ
jgi:hypothetical protein